MKRRLLGLMMLVFAGQTLIAQTADPPITEGVCSTMEIDAMLRQKYPEMGTLDEFETQFQRDITMYQIGRAEQEEVLTIPVIIHVIHNGEREGQGPNLSGDQVLSQIEAFTDHFRKRGTGANSNPVGADIKIEFAPALYDPEGKRLEDPGVDRVNGGAEDWVQAELEDSLKAATIWDPYQYFNVWSVRFGAEEAGLLGYAQFPPKSDLEGMPIFGGLAETDGVVLNYLIVGTTSNVQRPYHEGKTGSHEVGHWLGLRHTWGDGGCGQDDFCEDTPNASGRLWSKAFLGCPAEDECGEGVRMVANYLDYSDDGCRNVFTECQKSRMRTVMDVSPRRKELKNSTVHLERERPFARFAAEPTSACEASVIVFADLSTNTPSEWLWSVIDETGTIIEEYTTENPAILFRDLGAYDIRLIASNSAGADTLLRENYIHIVSRDTVTTINEDFENTQTVLEDWVIYNPDADQTFELAEVSAYGSGTQSIVMENFNTADDPGGAIDALVTPQIDLRGQDNPYFVFDHAYALFQNEFSDTLAILYSTDCTETFEVLWSRGGDQLATAPVTEDAFVPTNAQWATTQVSLLTLRDEPQLHLAIANISGFGNNLYLDNLQVDNFAPTAAPGPVTIVASATEICPFGEVRFEDQTPGFPNAWSWTFEGGTPGSSTEQNPTVTYNAPGTYDVSLTVTNSVGSTTQTFTDYITVEPAPVVSISIDKSSICPGEPFTLTASGATTYLWFDERDKEPVGEGPTYTTELYEERTIYVVGATSAECSDTTSLFVELEPGADVRIQASATEACPGDSVQFMATGGVSYIWVYNGDTVSTEASLELSFDENATVGVIGSVTSGCPGFDVAQVAIRDTDQPIVTLDGLVFSSTSAVGYQWYLGESAIEGATERTYAANRAGSYRVETTDSNGCKVLSEPVELTVTDIEDPRTSSWVRVYPNPSHGKFTLEIIGPTTGEIGYRIWDLTGKLVQEGSLGNSVTQQIRISDQRGIYFLEVYDDQLKTQLRIIK